VGHLTLGADVPFPQVYGGSPHLRGVESASWEAADGHSGFTLTSLDVPIMCMGEMTPFVTPRVEHPNMSLGVHWNIVQNIWNTNYVLWYPYLEQDKHTLSRFRMQFTR
jgi:hypothetical protein